MDCIKCDCKCQNFIYPVLKLKCTKCVKDITFIESDRNRDHYIIVK